MAVSSAACSLARCSSDTCLYCATAAGRDPSPRAGAPASTGSSVSDPPPSRLCSFAARCISDEKNLRPSAQCASCLRRAHLLLYIFCCRPGQLMDTELAPSDIHGAERGSEDGRYLRLCAADAATNIPSYSTSCSSSISCSCSLLPSSSSKAVGPNVASAAVMLSHTSTCTHPWQHCSATYTLCNPCIQASPTAAPTTQQDPAE